MTLRLYLSLCLYFQISSKMSSEVTPQYNNNKVAWKPRISTLYLSLVIVEKWDDNVDVKTCTNYPSNILDQECEASFSICRLSLSGHMWSARRVVLQTISLGCSLHLVVRIFSLTSDALSDANLSILPPLAHAQSYTGLWPFVAGLARQLVLTADVSSWVHTLDRSSFITSFMRPKEDT